MRLQFSSICTLALTTVMTALFCACGDTGIKEVDVPEIITNPENEIGLPSKGGPAGFSYDIVNAHTDGSVSAKQSQDWIYDIRCGSDTVSFTVTENQGDKEREASITIAYTYGEAATVEKTVRIIQAAATPPSEEYDTDITPVYADAAYQSDNEGLMDIRMVFTDMEVVDDRVTPPGSMLYVEALVTLNQEGALDTGEYSFALANEPYTVFPGQTVDFDGTPVTMGTYLAVFDENGTRTEHLITDGTMTVSGNAQCYNIACLFMTEEGQIVRCIWDGPLSIRNIPSAFSTLTGNYTLDLSHAVGSAKYFADMYGTGGSNWFIELKPSDGMSGDAVNVDLVSEGPGFDIGLVDGTYTAASGNSPAPGEYLRGTMSCNSLLGTVYMGDFRDGYPDSYAPAVSGNLEIANNPDGSVTLKFRFTDDKGYLWDGEWSGALEKSNLRP